MGPNALFSAFEKTISEYGYDFGQGVTVTDFMKQWTENAGYPMIKVVKTDDTFVITQVGTKKTLNFKNSCSYYDHQSKF